MWKVNLEETKRHYVDWWRGRGIVVNMWEHFQEGVQPHGPYAGEKPIHLTEALRNDYGTGAFALPGAPQAKSADQRWFDAEWRAEYLDWYVGHSCLAADMLPVANTQLGPGSLAAILGARYEGGEDTIWIHPDPDFKDALSFDPANRNLQIHRDLLRACKRKAQGNYYVGMPDLMEGLDVLAAMKGTDKVLLDTVMQPEVVEEQLRFINETYFKVFDELYDIIREGDEMAFCYFSAWAPGKMTKLQSDISTMISTDDYRRFVQPFIREQCQRIPYTLYHLDGVGALHHLPALLEIDELNAIQWTPGVGEPQGGDKKWYDLYRQILSHGKSIMACWVTLDELRPLLDNVGGDGIHLEMDFHSEAEVEQALRIVEEYQTHEVERKVEDCIRIGDSATLGKPKPQYKQVRPSIADNVTGGAVTGGVGIPAYDDSTRRSGDLRPQSPRRRECLRPQSQPQSLSDTMNGRVLILDGAMGTMAQQYGEAGTADILAVTRPDIIADIHRRYLAAGADIIETDTFSAQRVSLAGTGWENRVRELNLAACQVARRMADAFTLTTPDKPRYVAGSVGPTNKCVTMGLDSTELRAAYREQIEALIDGGVDCLLIETIFDMENAAEALAAVEECKGGRVPVILSFSQVNAEGKNMHGQDMYAFIERMAAEHDIFAVGLNCTAEPQTLAPIIKEMAARLPYNITVYGNAGMPDAHGRYAQTPQDFARQCWPLLDAHAVNIIGGCCGTTDRHIAALAQLVSPAPGCYIAPHTVTETCGDSNVTGGVGILAYDNKERRQECLRPQSQPQSLKEAIIAGNQDAAVTATEAAIAEGKAPAELVNTEMIEAMGVVGQRFSEGKAFVPQLLMAGRAMKAALALLKPIMEASGEDVPSAGRVVIGTVKGDLHDIGKNLVASMLEGSGFEVTNVGIDIDADTFVNAVRDTNADILCLSALLTTTMTYMRDVLAALEKAGLRDKVKVMVGGAPVSDDFAREIGADGYSSNANEAVALAKRLMCN